jgi:ribose-phosphate pyrophosphokinase
VYYKAGSCYKVNKIDQIENKELIMRNCRIFSGSSHTDLSRCIVEKLGTSLSPFTVTSLPNKEKTIDIEVSVRNQDVFIIQSGSDFVNDHLMELLILVNACKIASARRITAILTYFPYSKFSKKKKPRACITAKLVADMLTIAGVDHVITMDLHSARIQGFFDVPVDNLIAEPSIARYIKDTIPEYKNAVVVSKNAGGAKQITSFADKLNINFALIHKDGEVKYSFQPVSDVENGTFIPAASLSGSVESSNDLVTTPTIERKDSSFPINPNGITLIGDVSNRVTFILDDSNYDIL